MSLNDLGPVFLPPDSFRSFVVSLRVVVGALAGFGAMVARPISVS